MESQGWEQEKIDLHLKQVTEDFNLAELTALEKEMLSYAAKLTRDPASVQQSDIQRLQEGGCSAKAIHDLCAIVSYFNFVNRIADGLGVELENSSHLSE